ncbi:MAG: BatA domain-containing protein, partial [Planctomycetota bacterium]|nr:BatA domain-containing protein [Planctomycetota bacterium]
MFQVVQPLALLALGTLAVPILIHLWRRPLPVVRVGSLRPFLAHHRPSRARTLQDWPVFLLRCAILVALALAFAGLQWTPRSLTPARWCLLLPGTTLQDTHLQDWTLRLREGFEPRWLAPGFPRITDPTDSPAPSVRAPVWSLLSQADQRLAAGSEAWVFGPTWTSLFEGRRPSVANLRIQWHAVPTLPPVIAPRSAPRVGVVHPPDRVLDAGYVRAALQAMGASVVSNEVPSWIFQLGSAPLPFPWDELERHGVRIVRDAPEAAEPEVVARRIDVGSQTVTLRRRVVPGPGAPVLRDSHGDPWLTEERQGSVVLWHVAFR